MNNTIKANISVILSKIFSGIDKSALKYLSPLWVTAVSGTMFRCVFGAIVFWTIGFFSKSDNKTSTREKLILLLLGALFLYGYMFFTLLGLGKTTPVSASIFSSLQPIWVFILTLIFFKGKATLMKVLGIGVGLGGALLCTFTEQSKDLASDPFLGNIYCLISSLAYAIYLVLSNRVLKDVNIVTMMKYVFTGAAITSIIITLCSGFEAPVLSMPIDSTPFLVLLFVLIFPTVLTNILIPIGLEYLDTTTVAIYGYLVLIVATVTSLILGQDKFSWMQMGAILMICSSVYLVEIAGEKNHQIKHSEKILKL